MQGQEPDFPSTFATVALFQESGGRLSLKIFQHAGAEFQRVDQRRSIGRFFRPLGRERRSTGNRRQTGQYGFRARTIRDILTGEVAS
jgi:hypothetical protein